MSSVIFMLALAIGGFVYFWHIQKKTKGNKPFRSHLFNGPYQPCEIFQTKNDEGCPMVIRPLLGGRDIIFSTDIGAYDLYQWMMHNGYSSAVISFDGTVKVSFVL